MGPAKMGEMGENVGCVCAPATVLGVRGGDYRGGNSNQRPATEDQSSELDGLMIRELELRN